MQKYLRDEIWNVRVNYLADLLFEEQPKADLRSSVHPQSVELLVSFNLNGLILVLAYVCQQSLNRSESLMNTRFQLQHAFRFWGLWPSYVPRFLWCCPVLWITLRLSASFGCARKLLCAYCVSFSIDSLHYSCCSQGPFCLSSSSSPSLSPLSFFSETHLPSLSIPRHFCVGIISNYDLRRELMPS